jgi:acyl carrier protein
MIAEDRSMIAIDPRIDGIVQVLLVKRGVTVTLDAEGDLIDAGLTSIDMVNLMLAIEDEFDIEVPSTQMKPENFRNMGAIQALVASIRGAIT